VPGERLGRLRLASVPVMRAVSLLLADIDALQRIASHCSIRYYSTYPLNVHVGR
jgi:hypothetical protein